MTGNTHQSLFHKTYIFFLANLKNVPPMYRWNVTKRMKQNDCNFALSVGKIVKFVLKNVYEFFPFIFEGFTFGHSRVGLFFLTISKFYFENFPRPQ